MKDQKFEKEKIKKIVIACLEEFADISPDLSSAVAREAIAIRIASDLINLDSVEPVSPDTLLQKML